MDVSGWSRGRWVEKVRQMHLASASLGIILVMCNASIFLLVYDSLG